MIKMNEIKKIKKAFFEEGLSKNQICKQFHRSWETIDKIIKTSLEELEEREHDTFIGNRKATVGTPCVLLHIKSMLLEEKALRIKKKQRLTSKVI